MVRDKYSRYASHGRPPSLADLPTLTRDELGEATDALMRDAPTALNRASLHIMGGTTSTMRMGALPADLYLDEIAPHVNPFEPGDLLASLSTPFHMRASHDLHTALATRAGVPTLSMDAPTDKLMGPYLDLFEQQGVTALATTLDTVRRLLRFCAAAGRDLTFLRKVVWSGPAMDADTRALIRAQFPHLRTWALFGSAETWIIGHSGPSCSDDTLHLLPHQYTEIADGRMLVTVTHEKAVIPLLRYDTGISAEWAHCECGLPGPAIRTHSRIDAPLGPLTRLVSPTDLVALAHQLDSVDEAQVVVVDPHTEDERLHLRIRLMPGVEADLYTSEWIRHHVVSGCLALSEITDETPEVFEVVLAQRLLCTRPDGSAPPVVVREGQRCVAPSTPAFNQYSYGRLIT
ncbi:AMP-dependent synthetase [Nocardiopsis sp. NPDC049922]|uniref:AMP-dependent synthetase n=1 Tax=Nocardiopsis sp. NPDC049922 TaxID=3155157 RepID=UPI0033CE4C45